MKELRSLGALCGTVAFHVGFVVWVAGLPPPAADSPVSTLPAPEALLDVTWIDRATLAPEASRARTEATDPAPSPPRAVPESPPSPPPPNRPRQRASPPADPSPPSTPTFPQAPPDETNAAADAAAAVDEAPPQPPPPAAGADRTPEAAAPSASPGPSRQGTPSPAPGDAALDHTAYRAAIAKIVDEEIGRDPVGGIRSTDELEVELRVLPNGRLAKFTEGRFGYAEVVRSTVGPVRMRALLRRILRASKRFPPHPKGAPKRRQYVVGVLVRFNRGV